MPNEFIYLTIVTIMLAVAGYFSLRYERRARTDRERAEQKK